ncbi:uncharacterized protein MICPUCDRAFT_58485 [Micromonas pusilla CCMP1545]|uniref:Predicted protein n=1 Tax=Micromonas pusilla (strain CCMP1545) TaxID=564608 RepID=C1MSH2_MICPC|nr:uncharacterized protein MICPUCDRAFT_58485 [Micromonas pusilla CCMP1545]EEH57134.1 predicted protein [Micromonas pusilla CCMP1545]|eukprot:XP_003058679.1 predicted protein [Micromonas pusilla CCMP1545]
MAISRAAADEDKFRKMIAPTVRSSCALLPRETTMSPAGADDDPSKYLGRRVEVHWANDDPPTWYPGVVARYDPRRKDARYRVDYDDGADEWVDFPEPTVRFLDPEPAPEPAATSPAKRKMTVGVKRAAPSTAASPRADPMIGDDISVPIVASAKKGTCKGGADAAGAKKRRPAAASGKKRAKAKANDDGDAAVVDSKCDESLWTRAARATTASPDGALMPSTLKVLETFAGAGGLHMHGDATHGPSGVAVALESVAAIDIVKDACDTYSHNFPGVNVMHIGISRCLATARRLQRLKTRDCDARCDGESCASAPHEPVGELEDVNDDITRVLDFRITDDATHMREEDVRRIKGNKKGSSTKDKQMLDEVTALEVTGKKPLPWIEWLVENHRGDTWWERDSSEGRLEHGARVYMRADEHPEVYEEFAEFDEGSDFEECEYAPFGPHKFPLPGDVHVVTGGPPCQGWSGFNHTRSTSDQLAELMEHPENRLICRFM